MTQTGTVRTIYLVGMADGTDPGGRRFGDLIRETRRKLGWTQEDLVEESGVTRATIARWEAGGASNPEPSKVRAVFRALGIDVREAPVALGYVTREEMGLPPAPPRQFEASTEEVIAILEDPDVPEHEKREWVEYLRYRTNRRPEPRRRRPA